MSRADSLRRLYLLTCWIPAALWTGTLYYLSHATSDAINGWLALDLFVVPAVLSAVLLVLGLILIGVYVRRRRQIDVLLVIATLLGGSPILSFVLRH